MNRLDSNAPRKKRDRRFSGSAQKALAVLESFAKHRGPLTIDEIAQAARMARATVQRYAYTLERMGYLARVPATRDWVLTSRSLNIAYSYLSAHNLLESITTHLVDLNQACREAVNLSERDDRDMITVASFPSATAAGLIQAPMGRRVPLLGSAVGFAYLLALPPDEVQQLLLRSWRQGIALQDTADPLQVLAHVQAAREAGYASSEDTSYSGTLVIAAPVVGRDNRPQAVLDISVPRSRWTLPELRSALAPVLLAASHAAGRANPTA